MSHTTPDHIIAHVDLLRAVDKLLKQADAVRDKREALERLLSSGQGDDRRQAGTAEGRRDG
jgi:predicted membrane GTPase involved in stress response